MFRSKVRKVRCPDGSERVIHKNINELFPLSVSDIKAKVSAAANQVGADVVFQREARGFLVVLDEINASMQLKFRTAYITYSINPCEKGADSWLREQVQRISQIDDSLRSLRISVTLGESQEHILSEIKATTAKLRLPDPVLEAGAAFRNAKSIVGEWAEEGAVP